MALHDELADLRAEVGPQVFDDPVAFRAAFDDFIPEGSASTGEVSLLVGAIATGALQRVKDQLALGADPDMTIAVQGDLLARDRGTSESSGARWALSVLAHATGAIPVNKVLTRPTPGPDSVDTTGGKPSTLPPPPSVVDPGPTRPVGDPPPPPPSAAPSVSSFDPTWSAGAKPPAPATSAPGTAGTRKTSPLLIATVVVLTIVAATALALLVLRDGSPNDTAKDSSSDTAANPGEEVLAQIEMSEAGKTVQVQLVSDGTDTSVVLLAEQDGEYVEVDREAATCPFHPDTSYDATLQDEGDRQIYLSWQDEEIAGWAEYGEVQIDEDKLILYDTGDIPCPEAP